MRRFLLILLSVVCINCSKKTPNVQTRRYSANKIGELPATVNGKNPGVAGPFSGIVTNKLIIAGGANFPDKKPWEGGTKIYHDKIYAFELDKDSLKLIDQPVTLPEPLAYGASVSLEGGILCIGGNNPDKCSSKVFLIGWDETANIPVIRQYPELPVPLSFTTAVVSDSIVYVTGGSSTPDAKDTLKYCFRLDLSQRKSPDFKWEKLPPYPGISRTYSVAAAQSDGKQVFIYLFSGRNTTDPVKPVVFDDGLKFDPVLQKWEHISVTPASYFPVMAGAAFPDDSNNIIFIGGAADSLFMKEHQLKTKLSDALNGLIPDNPDALTAELTGFYLRHSGFSQNILLYNTITNTISIAGRFTTFCPVTTCVIPFGDGAIITSGEIKPGIRTPDIFSIKLFQQIPEIK